MSDSENNAQFRFKWDMIAEAEFFYQQGDSIYCILSRASIRDSDLIDIAERESKMEKKESAGEDTMEDADLKVEENIISQGLEKVRIGGRETTEPNIPNDMELHEHLSWESFCRNKINVLCSGDEKPESLDTRGNKSNYNETQSKRKKRKLPNKDLLAWMVGLSFEEYWKTAGSYLVSTTWLSDYDASMDEATRREFQKKILEMKPVNLLPTHRSRASFENMVYKNDPSYQFVSWEDWYNRHSELVRKQAAKDFEASKSDSVLSRCQNFVENATMCGFIPGVEAPDIAGGNASSSTSLSDDEEHEVGAKRTTHSDDEFESAKEYTESEDRKQTSLKKRRKERQLVNYDGLETFDDVCADFYGSPLCLIRYGKNALGKKKMRKNTDEDLQELASSPTTMVLPEDLKNFDFGFDVKRDAWLVAKDACQTYRDDKEMRKYWFQRYRLFSKLNQGILMDREGWFSVTPERIAQNIADRVVLKNDAVVVDAFAGVGGNSIQMALRGAYVIAIDLDPVRIRCAIQNARVYGVADRINFICADFFHFAEKFEGEGFDDEKNAPFDAVFLSPPWGGPSYLNVEVFDLNSDLTPNGFKIFTAARRLSPNIAYFLPRHTSVKQLISLAGKGGSCEVEHSLLNKKIKAITAYYGNLIAK